MKKFLYAAVMLCLCGYAAADTLEVHSFRMVDPVVIASPLQLDSTDVNGKKFDENSLLDVAVNLKSVENAPLWQGDSLPKVSQLGVGLLGFGVNNRSYFKGNLDFKKHPANYQLYIDGKRQNGNGCVLEPGSHQFVIKYLAKPSASDSLQLLLVSDSAAQVPATSLQLVDNVTACNYNTIQKLVAAKKYSTVQISPNGKWILTATFKRTFGNDGEWEYALVERSSGRTQRVGQYFRWMPTTNKYYRTSRESTGIVLWVTDPETGREEKFAEGLPEGNFSILAGEDKLLYTIGQDGPAELNPDAFEIIHPDDRQPGWRHRSTAAIYSLQTGVMQPITFGYNNQWVADVSLDGTKALVIKSEATLTQRPTSVSSVYLLDLTTLKADTLVCRDGFVGGGSFSPDNKQVLYKASPEAFGGVGNVVPEGMTPNMYDNQLYLQDIQTKEIKSLTKEFNPSVQDYDWSDFDGRIYFTAEQKDSVLLYRLDPKKNEIVRISQPEEVVNHFAVARQSGAIVLDGESATNSSRLYSLEIAKKQPKGATVLASSSKLLVDLNADLYAGMEMCECKAWTFTNSIGDEVCCRYYLPNGFDEGQQYPMIVYYYGGCSPTSRNFEYTYPMTIWAANGYAVLVVNPSGATGFGQEWSARHVNTAGKDPARDIIEATQIFCQQHHWVNDKKLGCIGASYGGFMTQYLQTKTDIFCCAVSHAGISDHSNYWGYGYWGYTYSEVSMANSYPWNRKDLYVDESPLYNVDKVKSAMLFLHGTDDTNVPYNNSLQMYTALKLLGREVAMVSIKGENHGIRDPKKRVAWHNATMAWFARFLKDDPTWWEALYPKKTL